MPLFTSSGNNLIPVKEQKIDLEKDIQRLTELNLESVFGLKFVSTEFALNNFRIDSLAYDEEAHSFIIIEYKRDRSFSVVDQGFAYLALMLNNKADFILEYNEKTGNQIKRDDIDWSQSRVIFIANSFTTYQQEAISFKDLRFELWEVKKYDNSTFLFNQIKADKSSESIKTVTNNSVVEKVTREVKTYTANDHFKPGWEASREIYDALRPRILDFDTRIVESPQKYYIGYKIANLVLFNVTIKKSGITMELYRVEPKDLLTPGKPVKYVKDSMKHYNKHVSTFFIADASDIEYALFLAQQVYKRFA